MNDNFETLLTEYKSIMEELSKDDIALEKSIELYQKSEEIYKKLNSIINDAKQKITNVRESNV